jgi:hypothetical protein
MIADIQNTKIDLIQWLTTLNDEKLIEKIVDLRKNESKDWWNETSKAEKDSIEKGIADADAGKLVPHETARKLYEKWL